MNTRSTPKQGVRFGQNTVLGDGQKPMHVGTMGPQHFQSEEDYENAVSEMGREGRPRPVFLSDTHRNTGINKRTEQLEERKQRKGGKNKKRKSVKKRKTVNKRKSFKNRKSVRNRKGGNPGVTFNPTKRSSSNTYADTSNANANSWIPWARDTSKFETPFTSDPLAGRQHGVESRGELPPGYQKRDDRGPMTSFYTQVNKDKTRYPLMRTDTLSQYGE